MGSDRPLSKVKADLGIAFSEPPTRPCVGPLGDAAWSQGNIFEEIWEPSN